MMRITATEIPKREFEIAASAPSKDMNDFGKIRTLIIELSQLGVLDQRKILALLWQVTAEERQCDKVSSMVDELEGLVLPLAIAAAVGDQDTLNERKAHSLELINRLQVKCGFNNAA